MNLTNFQLQIIILKILSKKNEQVYIRTCVEEANYRESEARGDNEDSAPKEVAP